MWSLQLLKIATKSTLDNVAQDAQLYKSQEQEVQLKSVSPQAC